MITTRRQAQPGIARQSKVLAGHSQAQPRPSQAQSDTTKHNHGPFPHTTTRIYAHTWYTEPRQIRLHVVFPVKECARAPNIKLNNPYTGSRKTQHKRNCHDNTRHKSAMFTRSANLNCLHERSTRDQIKHLHQMPHAKSIFKIVFLPPDDHTPRFGNL